MLTAFLQNQTQNKYKSQFRLLHHARCLAKKAKSMGKKE
jgi:hypothetical protein